MKASSVPLRRWLITAAIVLVLAGQACTISLFNIPGDATATPSAAVPTGTPFPAVSTTFVVNIPEALQPGESLVLAVVDEVTGLSLHEERYPLSPRDPTNYTGSLPVKLNSTLKYRYIRLSGQTAFYEDTNAGEKVRYRMHYAAVSGEVQDIVADWSDKTLARATGSIKGKVLNADTGAALPNILVTAGGIQSFTDSQGQFELPGLPVGIHQLVAYSLDGYYLPFQQGASVADGITTAVDLRVKPARLVNVTFNVTVPQDTVPGVPVRIAGNLLQFGNTFADLQGGMSVVTDRMPIMELQPDGRYAYRLGLPAGTHLQYKYTLGDGYWNAEHDSTGGWVVRDFFIPEQDVTLNDTVATWLASNQSGPILFEVNIPSVTPPEDIVYIQFKTFGWTEPIPMWPSGRTNDIPRWSYQLYSPLNFNGAFSYRFCRNGQCGSADDSQTTGANPAGRQTSTSFLGQDLIDTVGSWKWYENPETLALVGTAINKRNPGFVAGVEYLPIHRPNFAYYNRQSFANAKAIGSNFIVLTPSWTVSKVSPLRFGLQPSQDPFWIDTAIQVSQARAIGLNVAIFPSPHFPTQAGSAAPASAQFWQTAPRDAAWWQAFYTQYHDFIVNYADLAAQSGAQSIILGGDWVKPSLPNGLMPDGSSSNVPADAEAQWRRIIQDTRAHFKGQVFWAMPYEKSSIMAPVNFLLDMDGIYLLWSAPIGTSATATKTDFTNETGRILDNEIFPLSSLLNKPIILAVSYPAAAGAASACVPNGGGGCLDFDALSRPNDDLPSASLSLQTQADIYESILIAANSRPWLAGFISRGFYLPAFLQDKSTSVHGKPAANVLWYWYPRLLGTVR
jgi:hypothetical protein